MNNNVIDIIAETIIIIKVPTAVSSANTSGRLVDAPTISPKSKKN